MLCGIRNCITSGIRCISLFRQSNKRYEINNNSEFVNKVMNGTVPVIVNFHADWCDPCKILTPKLIELIEPMEKVDLAIVDVEENPELVHVFEVKAVPAVIAISNGLVVDKFIGLVNNEMIENLIQKLTHEGPINTENENTKT
ncbi:thioredoxin, mitochondrial [Pseudomyrmex gracilis]|uniref:thioredoxin, mitochondrial n=1 Tax=Pseudomyrmex gracilis TaxID=219809 RepID=UPI000995AD73|nr:thioredoxin, mitochondrial [Pseudomyrmex gracilis]